MLLLLLGVLLLGQRKARWTCARDCHGETAVMLAAHAGHLAALRRLHRAGAALGAHSRLQRTALHLACTGGHTAVAAYLLAHGLDVNARTAAGRTPLHVAAAHGHSHMLETLRRHHADLDAQDRFGRTPLACAAVRGDALLVRSLLRLGACAALADCTGATPEQHARQGGHQYCTELLQGRTHGFTYVDQVRAMYNFAARDANELSIQKGDVVNVLWRHPSGWWIGEHSAQTGLFPGNYTVPIPGSATVHTKETLAETLTRQ